MKTRRISALLLCLLMLCSTAALCACGDKNPELTESKEVTYKVAVVDGLGNPYTEKIIVKFVQNGTKVAMAPIGKNGVVEKSLPKGDYSVELDFTGDSECYYDSASAKLTADKTELTITLAYLPSENTTSIYANSIATGENTGYEAVNVGVGSVYVTLDTADRTYFLFTPAEAGTYQISTTGGATTIGYYGAPHFVQSQNVGDVKNNVLTLSVSASMISTGNTGTSVYVIGVDSVDGTADTILNVVRTGDPAWNIADEPYSVYQAKSEIKDFTLPAGTKLTDFDVTAATDAYVLVLNEQDHCYHLGTADGPAVYVNLEKAVYGISMLAMVGENIFDADGVPIESGTSPFRYVKNNGPDDFFKEDYTAVTREIITARDKTTGVYPLTEDLYYILNMGVEHMGWTRENTANYLFNGEPNVNSDIAWMFLMCHAQDNTTNPGENTNPGGSTSNPGQSTKPGEDTKPDPIEDNKDEPIMIGGTLEFEAEVKANHIVYFDLLRVNDTTLTIKSKDAYVIYNGKTFEAKNGVVTVPNLFSQYTNVPVQIAIGNSGSKDATFDVKLSYPAGHRENPHALKMESFSVSVAKNNDQGVYYSWKATKDGTLTITLDKVTSKSGTVVAGITVTVSDSSLIPVQYVADENNTITVQLKAGDDVEIVIGVLPNAQNRYLAATIDVTASFK